MCHKIFTYPVGRGNDRKHCSAACRESHHRALQAAHRAAYKPCSTPGCRNKANRVGARQCETCYYRVRRTGTTDAKPIKGRYVTRNGYFKVLDRKHPLVDKHGHVFEHRYVLYDKIGPAPHSCYWCSAVLPTWKEIVVDHLDDDKHNNAPDNLVSACNRCNRARGAVLPFVDRISEAMLAEVFHRFAQRKRRASGVDQLGYDPGRSRTNYKPPIRISRWSTRHAV